MHFSRRVLTNSRPGYFEHRRRRTFTKTRSSSSSTKVLLHLPLQKLALVCDRLPETGVPSKACKGSNPTWETHRSGRTDGGRSESEVPGVRPGGEWEIQRDGTRVQKSTRGTCTTTWGHGRTGEWRRTWSGSWGSRWPVTAHHPRDSPLPTTRPGRDLPGNGSPSPHIGCTDPP